MNFNIAVIRGDGIGPEIMKSATDLLDAIGKIFNHKFNYDYVLAGGASIDKFGVPLRDEAVEQCLKSDSVMLAAVGGSKWDTLPGHLRPERALLGLRKALKLYANIRPAKLYEVLKSACPLKDEISKNGIDMVIVRELTGGIYYGVRGRGNENGVENAYDTELYSVTEIERIARTAFRLAQLRGKKVVSIDKANVLESSRLWREVVHKVAKDYPDVTVSDMLVDNAAMQLVRNPSQFDVIVTSNMFGDILSDEASQLTGSIGLLPSASLGEGKLGLYEPIHGSAPDIAGQDIANPIATMLSAAMMLRYSFELEAEAVSIENAINKTLLEGYRTRDISDGGKVIVGTREMTRLIIEKLYGVI